MRRRSLLALFGTLALGGCQQMDPRPFEDIQPRKVAGVTAETNYDVALSVNASVVEEMITPDTQARIELTVEWQGSEPVRFAELPSQRYRSFSPNTIWILRPERNTNRRNQETWVVADDSTAFQSSQVMVSYEPGETVTQEYDIWANPYESTSIESGQYESSETVCRDDGWCTSWDFDIEITPA